MNMKECERLRKIEKVGENEREIEKYWESKSESNCEWKSLGHINRERLRKEKVREKDWERRK